MNLKTIGMIAAIVLAAFAFDISEAVALAFTRRSRGRHAR